MPNATLRANARTTPKARRSPAYVTPATRASMERVVERLLAALDALDAVTEDLEDSHDREDDPAELGIADGDALDEIWGSYEPSLGATEAINQDHAWRIAATWAPVDGEMQGTEDDLPRRWSTAEDREASRVLRRETERQVRKIALPRETCR